MSSQHLFQIQSTIIVLLMILGILKRKNRKFHVRTMSTVIIWDIVLILQIELSRDAVYKAVTVNDNSNILNFHVSLAISTVLLYFAMIYTGRKFLKDPSMRPLHGRLGRTAFALRLLTYITSFFIVK